jgi:hypothetical protein
MVMVQGVRGLALAVVAVVLTAAQLNLPSDQFWEKSKFVLYFGLGILILGALIDCWQKIREPDSQKNAAGYDADVRAVLSGGIKWLSEQTSAPWDEISIEFFVPRGRYWWCRLHRVGMLRLGARVRPQSTWKVGCGIVGRAFALDENLMEDWVNYYAAASDDGQEKWKLKSEAERYGLEWRELIATHGDRRVAAIPVIGSDSRRVGCLFVEGPMEFTEMIKPSVKDTLVNLRNALAVVGAPSREWWQYRNAKIQ